MTKNDHFNRKAAARARLQDEFPAVPEGFHRRMAETLDGLEEKPVKRKMHWSAVLVAAVILTLATGAIAATYRTGWVDFDGNFTPEDPIMPEVTHYEPNADAIALDPPAGEYWEVVDGNSCMGSSQNHVLDSMEELNKLLENSPLHTVSIPENFNIDVITVETPAEPKPYESTTLSDGRTMKKYNLAEPDGTNISVYEIMLRPEGQGFIHVSARLEGDNFGEYRFSVSELDHTESIDIPGYNKALYIAFNDDHVGNHQLQAQYSLPNDDGTETTVTMSIEGYGNDVTKELLMSMISEIE